ncbi:MAG: cyclic pyranopterin monophosphate synthase MoaC [Armatimonadota bacterium]
MHRLSHTDGDGRARMIDIGGKYPQRRIATARGHISLSDKTRELIRENEMKKGDVLTVAQVAGIQAAKNTPQLIPLCHPLSLDDVDVQMEPDSEGIMATATVACTGRTGVEMEALTAVSVALLAVYDMCKAVDSSMQIGEITLLEKVKSDVRD